MLLKKAVNEMAYAKVGLMGFAGSGKSFTALLIAMGLHGYIKSKKPIAFLDTETGSDFLIGKLKKAGIELLVAKSKSFADLMTFCKEAQEAADIAIVDSISHFWAELQESYIDKINEERQQRGRNKITKLEFQHWQPIKRQWGKFTETFLSSKIHFIVAGRSGYEYEFQENPDTEKKELVKSGTKMRAEGEMAYEPSLLIEMERAEINPVFTSGKGKKGQKGERTVVNRAFVRKDRFDVLDGQTFDNPTFESFLPHFQLLNLGGEHRTSETQQDSTVLFDGEGRDDWQIEKNKRVKLCEEIQGLLVFHFPGQSAEDKKMKASLLRQHFNTLSWTAVEGMDSATLRSGYEGLKAHLEPGSQLPPDEEPRQPGE